MPMTTPGDPPDGLTNGRSENSHHERASSVSEGQNGLRRVSSPPQPLKRASTTPITSATTSTNTSPKTSREASPIRPPLKPGILPTTRSTRSRKNSHELSPHRPPNASNPTSAGVPSAAAVQRALSAAGTPRLPSPTTSEFSIDAPQPQKGSKAQYTAGGFSKAVLPPRLKSPPPAGSSNRTTLYSPRRPDYAPLTPSIIVDRATPTSASSFDEEIQDLDPMARGGIKSPIRGSSGSKLETVQESSLPSTPAIGMMHQLNNKQTEKDRPSTIEENPLEKTVPAPLKTPAESGSESGGNRSIRARSDAKDIRKPSTTQPTSRPPNMSSKRSMTQLNSAKAKIATEGSAKNMTVETETVSSVPQIAVGGGAERNVPGRTETTGSLRLKPSTETIKLKKDKRKTARKSTSINSGTASSKADIFEAKVASAVDEANSSDSEETFVYESNPPEPLSARPNYYHSRTPSATSMASQVNQHDPRFRTDGHHSITGKKSMKFTNNPHHSLHGGQAENGYNGTVGSGRASGGNGSHLHYIGRHGRGPTGHASLFDNEGPFSKPPRTSVSNGNRLSPRPTTPRSANLLRSPAKTSAPLLYDLEGEGADDERTPLILSLRSGRNRNSRRPANRMDSYNQPNGFCRRLTGCLVIGTALALFIALVIVGLILCSKPLVDVKIKDIENVLPTDQELMFDLHVHAINPNLVAIQITELGIDVYAKSQYVPASSFFRHRHDYWDFEVAEDQDEEEMGSDGTDIGTEDYRLGGGKDEGNDPIDDPDSKQWTLLGRIFEFDAPLIFDPSPLRRKIQSSVGEVRLARPGNHTEGISNWWEKVIQHPFDLKVRGPFLYSLPISSKLQKVAVTATTTVSPDVPDAPADDDPDTGNLHISSFVRRRRIAFAG